MINSAIRKALPYIRILVSVPIATTIYNAFTSFVISQPFNVPFIRSYGLWLWDIIMTIIQLAIYAVVSYLFAPIPVKRKALFIGFAYCGLSDAAAKGSFLLPLISIENAIKTQYIAALILWVASLLFMFITYRQKMNTKGNLTANNAFNPDAE